MNLLDDGIADTFASAGVLAVINCHDCFATALLPNRQFPAGPDEMTSVPGGIPLEVILMLRLGLPKRAGGGDLRHNMPGHSPDASTSAIVSSRHLLLLVGRVENRGAVTRARIVTLAIARAQVMDLEKNSKSLR